MHISLLCTHYAHLGCSVYDWILLVHYQRVLHPLLSVSCGCKTVVAFQLESKEIILQGTWPSPQVSQRSGPCGVATGASVGPCDIHIGLLQDVHVHAAYEVFVHHDVWHCIWLHILRDSSHLFTWTPTGSRLEVPRGGSRLSHGSPPSELHHQLRVLFPFL